MANDQRTQNPCVVKGSETSNQEKKTEQQAEKQFSKPGDQQTEKKPAAFAAASSADTKTENQSSNLSNNSSNTYGPYHSENRKAVSLAHELRDLEYGLCALKKLQDILEADDTDDVEELVQEISAILALLIYRITLVRLVVEGELDPAFIWSIWNDAGPCYWDNPAGNDVVFEEWTANQKLIHARFLLDQAERRVAEELAKQRERNK